MRKLVIQQLESENSRKLVKSLSEVNKLPSGRSFRVDHYRTVAQRDDLYYEKHKSLYLRRGVAAVYHLKDLTFDESDLPEPSFLLFGIPKFGYAEDVLTTRPNWDILDF